jgi:ABC-2 type transport system permease protein
VWAIIVKEFRQLRRDPRTVVMLSFIPVLLLVLFGYAASFDVKSIPARVVGPRAERLARALPPPFQVERVEDEASRTDAEDALRDGDVPVAFVTDTAGVTVLLDGSELFIASAATAALASLAEQMPDSASARVEVLFNEGLETSAVMIPGLAAIILLFVGGLVTSLGVVRERQAGTLEQLAVMPFRPRDVFLGKIGPYFLVAAVDLTIVVSIGVWVFDVPFRGSVLVFGTGALLFLFVTLGLGVLISSVSQNQGQAIQLSIMTLLPQIFLSGLIFPLSSMAAGVRWIGYLLPLTYFLRIARGVMVRGATIDALWPSFLYLAVLGTGVFGLATVRFRAMLEPSRRRRGRRIEPVKEAA